MLNNLINPQVIGSALEVKLADLIKFSPIARMGYDLQGTAGNTLTIPVYAYIGDATDVAEGEAIDTSLLSATTKTVTVKKAGKAVEITDEALLSAYGDPQDEAERQLGIALAQKIDNDVLAALETIGTGMTYGDGTAYLDKDLLADALVKFGEDIDEPTFLFISPAQYASLRKDPDFVNIQQGQAVISGEVGQLLGVRIVVSNKIKPQSGVYHNFLVRSGAVGIEMKREVMVEADRDILKKTNVISADVHYVAYLRDESKAVKIVAKA
jgi:N4-gp56 family major capsid protein